MGGLLRAAIAVAAMMAFTACVDASLNRCGDGLFCPQGLVCVEGGRCAEEPQVRACQGVAEGEVCDLVGIGFGVCRDLLCIVGKCGNGEIDPDEVCDDGNTDPRDGCAADCRSNEQCGNGIWELDEECDCGTLASPGLAGLCEGTVNGGPKCAEACIARRCGNDILEDGEVCDDKNLVDGDGCRADCLSDETCGNGEFDPIVGEQCDDGNRVDFDGCQSNCRLPGCGDEIVDPGAGEVCDDGNQQSGDGCRDDCASDEVCGTGATDPRGADGEPANEDDEECDDGNLVDFDGCQSNCRIQRCGDLIVDVARGEQCDDGNQESGDRCSADCRSDETCGNGVVDTDVDEVDEECDDGDRNSDTPDAFCRLDCRLRRCGDQIVDPALGEACDAGAANSDDPDAACRSNCQPQRCGDGIVDADEACDDGGQADGDGCSADCASNEVCGNGTIDFVLGELCDDAAANRDEPDAACRRDCQPQRCGDAIVDAARGEMCDDGDRVDGDGCNAACTSTEVCDNGFRDPGEVCDDGNGEDTDACPRCAPAVCGDGFVWAGVESCDEGPANSSAPDAVCRTTCQPATCGDGTIDPALGEACDDGVATADLPNARCRLGALVPAQRCQFRTCGDGIRDNLFGEGCDDGNDDDDDACLTACAVARCGDGAVHLGVEVCDDGNLLVGDGCDAVCASNETCGNGVVDPVNDEACDDGNLDDDDACRNACRLNGCGDDVHDPDGRDNLPNTADDEACDDGNLASGDGCAADCASDETCGNGVVDAVNDETCDDGNLIDDDACRNDCRVNGCGDGVHDPDGRDNLDGTADDEGCDDGDADDRDACTTACRPARCGDGIIETGEEMCDDGDSDDLDECTTTCTLGALCHVASSHALSANPERLFATVGAVVVPSAPALCLGSTFTVETWFRRVSGPGDPVFLGTLAANQTGFALGMVNNNFASAVTFRVATATGLVSLVSARGTADPAALADGAWHHVAATGDGTSLRLYVDGALEATAIYDGQVMCGGANLLLGSMPQLVFGSGGIPTYVDLDEVRLSGAVLYPHEFAPCVQYGPAPGAIAHWRLDQASSAAPFADALGGHPGTSTIGPIEMIAGSDVP